MAGTLRADFMEKREKNNQVQVVLSFCVDVYVGLVCCRFVVGLSCRVTCNEKAGVEFVMHAGIFSVSFIADA